MTRAINETPVNAKRDVLQRFSISTAAAQRMNSRMTDPLAEGLDREAIVLFSGGIDSTACIHLLRTQGLDVTGLFIDYSQAALRREEHAVRSVSELLCLPVDYIRMEGFHNLGSGELQGRNALLMSVALFWSRGKNCLIGTGIHSGSGYYDCSSHFLTSMKSLFSAQTDGRVALVSPFEDWTKQDIYDYATTAQLPLDRTYSCENGTVPTCGFCASCRDRKILGC